MKERNFDKLNETLDNAIDKLSKLSKEGSVIIEDEFSFTTKIHRDLVNKIFDISDKPAPEAVATVSYYSDRKSFDIIASTPKTITLRERKAICVKPPVMEAGGFAGVVTENAVWRTESNPNGVIRKASLRKNGDWRLSGYTTSGKVHLGIDDYYYDYSF